MKKIFRLERLFISQYLKQLIEYKGDFLVGLFGFLLEQGLNILMIAIIFTKIPDLKGWSLQQVIFIYGFSLIPKGLDHLFFDNLWAVGQRLVRKGDFDKYMTRPINPLVYVLIETFQVDAIGEIFVGILLLASSWGSIHWGLLKILLFIIVIPFSTAIYTSLKIALSSLAFWMKQSGSLLYVFYQINDFAKYPVTIYNNGVKFLISFIIPFAFTAYYPAKYFLTNESPLFNIGTVILISIMLLCGSLWIWNKGISAYESSGS
ncbi:ABC transporter permease [Lactococcus lactis]|uniref:ABC transporter permease n=1 Tax=Lactococcus lactis TaxID=1358 RepID=UPI0022E739EF|nr:ABC-2 family transporter protein [Lactococcus lactis]